MSSHHARKVQWCPRLPLRVLKHSLSGKHPPNRPRLLGPVKLTSLLVRINSVTIVTIVRKKCSEVYPLPSLLVGGGRKGSGIVSIYELW